MDDALARLQRAAETRYRQSGERTTRVTVEFSAGEMERLRLLAEELATSPRGALRQLAGRGRRAWAWLLWIDLRHQARTLFMQKLHRGGKRVGFKLPRISDGD
ncbi:MAG: hypothetical protein NVSMB65_06370 [Chloroflexota bacterium]